MPDNASRDENFVPTLIGVSSADGRTPITVYVDPVTHRLKVDLGGGGSGTVQTVAVASANGFAGTSDADPTNPVLTLTTTVTGILQGDGTAISAASTTGTGAVVLATSPTLVTPVLGVATATSINRLTITQPATGSTLTIADGKTLTQNATQTFAGVDGKTLTFNNSITFAGTDATVMTFPTTSATIARTDAAQTFTGVQSMTSPAITTGITAVGASFALINTVATTVTFAGAATTLTVGGTPTTAITHNYSTNATATATTKTVNIGTAGVAGSTTNVNIGSSVASAILGTLSLNFPTILTANNNTTVALWNTLSTTINFAGAATTLTMGAATGTTTIANPTVTFSGATVFNINGASPSIVTSSTGTASVFNTNALVGNLFGAATTLTIGGTPTSAITHNYSTNATAAATTKTVNLGTGGASSSTTNVNIGATPGGTTTINSPIISLGGTTGATTTGTIELGAASDTTIARSAAGQITVEGVQVVTATNAVTVTNKRPQPRTASSTTSSNLSPDLASANVYYRTTQTATLTIDAPIGTPVIGETIMIYVDSAGAQTLTINSTYKAFGAAFPATTTAGKTFMMSARYNGTDWKTLWANAV